MGCSRLAEIGAAMLWLCAGEAFAQQVEKPVSGGVPAHWFPAQQTPPGVRAEQPTVAPSAVSTQPQVVESPTASAKQVPAKPTSTSPWLIGAFYRHQFITPFMLDIFTEEMTGVNNPSAGIEFIREFRRFDVIASLWWQNFHAYEAFRDDGDAEIETEIINSKLWSVFAGVSVLGTLRLHRMVAFQYGGDFGFGVLGGTLHRTDAYRDGDGKWQLCEGPGVPDSEYCASPAVGDDSRDGGHYNVRARRWAEGGSVPNIWIRVAPHLALKVTPHDRVAVRVDTGLDFFSGFFLGASVAVRLGEKAP